jgi:hypothetical protein
MARWLTLFTPSDLADALRVPPELGEQFVHAMLFHGIVEDTGDELDGPLGAERVYEMPPLPPGPNEHPHLLPPEIMAVLELGGFEIITPRGLPVRIRTERQMRRSLSTPGARQVHRNRERAYERQKAAEEARREADRAKGAREPKWKRKGKGKTVAVQGNKG